MQAPPPPPFHGAPNILIPPPLPSGWTEHIAPGGQPYFYNTITKESSYIRPLPSFPVQPYGAGLAPQTAPPVAEKKKKEKPKVKTPVPGTKWIRVLTTAGNVFYTHTERKESVWSVPEEIKDAVAQLEQEEGEREVLEARRKQQEAEERRKAIEAEVERVKKEVDSAAAGKRKAATEPEPLDELVSKKARVEDAEEDEDEEEESEEEEEEEWQREAAAQLAAEAEAEERRREEEEKRMREEEEELKRKEKEKGSLTLNMPNRVDLSIEEAKALFKTLLREKDVNPLLPWDTALPQFISDPRYVLLPSVSARRDAFDEYCRDRARELRQAKLKQAAATEDRKEQDPRAEFDGLLRAEVTSTRTSWNEWRRAWKKDRRFYGWGRDDREREKRFREWLKELGEQKRKAAAKAETDFFTLLKEKANITSNVSWKDAKRGLDKDPRYDAVGSSSLREELFNTFMKTLSGSTSHVLQHADPTKPENREKETAEDRNRKDKERKERAVKEREEQVRRERGRVEMETARSRSALSREESELEFMTLLTDAIRESSTTWASSIDQLKTDPRFTLSALPSHRQQGLFHQHIDALRMKHISALHTLFAAHAPALNTELSELPVASIQTSLPAQKLQLHNDSEALAQEYSTWRAMRKAQAIRDFQEMLDENAFVEFWGRVRKMREEKEDGMKVEVGAEDLAGEEEEGENGKIDLKTLAKSVDVREIERVLKNDRRYTIFDHIPDQREAWIRAHVEKLVAPKLSVHVPEHGQ